MENKSFTDLARSIAEERYPATHRTFDGLTRPNVGYKDRIEAYEACINERVKPLYEALQEIGLTYLPGTDARLISAQAIANFEGGVKVEPQHELDLGLIKQSGYIPQDGESGEDWEVTPESLKAGTEMANAIFKEQDKEFKTAPDYKQKYAAAAHERDCLLMDVDGLRKKVENYEKALEKIKYGYNNDDSRPGVHIGYSGAQSIATKALTENKQP